MLDQIGWAELQAATQLRSYGPGEVIVLEGDPPEAVKEKVLRLLAQDLSNPEIAEQLNPSAGTVGNDVSVAFAKLDMSDRVRPQLWLAN